jgi:hypothetical protein
MVALAAVYVPKVAVQKDTEKSGKVQRVQRITEKTDTSHVILV